MATLQIRNVPDELHERLRRFARERNQTMSAVVLAAVERAVEQAEWHERMANRPTRDIGETAAEALEAVRAERAEWYERVADRPIVDLGPGGTAAQWLEEARAEREKELGLD